MDEILEIIIRILISIAVLIFLARIDGAKQISQMTYYDYIIGITVGSIAGALCIDMDINILHGVLGIALFMLSGIFVSFLTNKSIWARRILTGQPIFLIAKGEILYKGLKRSRLDINDFLRELRVLGYFDITEINYAILESNGSLSVMPKAYARPPKVADMAIKLKEDGIKANVIIDGKILKKNLEAFNKSVQWLKMELKKQDALSLKDIILGTLDEEGSLNIYYKNEDKNIIQTSFM